MNQKDEIRNQMITKSKELDDNNGLLHQLSGMLMALNDSLKGFKMELHNEKYTHIEKTILDLNVKFCLTRDISLEVSEKHDALETALMQYHHEKMKDINQTLADFWKLTYKGHDIETIEIKSDVEKSATN